MTITGIINASLKHSAKSLSVDNIINLENIAHHWRRNSILSVYKQPPRDGYRGKSSHLYKWKSTPPFSMFISREVVTLSDGERALEPFKSQVASRSVIITSPASLIGLRFTQPVTVPLLEQTYRLGAYFLSKPRSRLNLQT